MSKGKVFSGIRPTAESPHLGNFFGAIVNWVKLQQEYECLFCLVDYHTITEDYDPRQLPQRTFNMAADLLACGIDPERSTLFVQSAVPEHAELAWVLNCLTSYGDLQRMTQFKDKSEGAEFVSAGLFNYPVLMAADILMYHTTVVPVGDDQDQHVELTRRIARRFNSRYGEYFKEPETLHTAAPRIMSTADPTVKMSKSLGPKHTISLFEPENSLHEKIKSAVTDAGPQGGEMGPGVKGLFLLLQLAAPQSVCDALKAQYQEGKLKYVALKEAVYEHLMKALAPIRKRRQELGLDQVQHILARGAQRAQAQASQTMRKVRRLIGVAP